MQNGWPAPGKKTSMQHEEIGVASTGVIGRYLDKAWLSGHFDEVYDSLSGSKRQLLPAPRNMTTDTTMKEVAIQLDNGVRIAGIARLGNDRTKHGNHASFPIYRCGFIKGKHLIPALKKPLIKVST